MHEPEESTGVENADWESSPSAAAAHDEPALPPSPEAEHHAQPIRLGQRVFLVGTPGSGKSEVGAHLFAVHGGQRVLIDPQDHMSLGPDALAEDPPPLEVDRASAIDWRHRTIRYVPRRPGDRNEMDRLHAAIYRRENLLVVVDEAEDVAPSQGGGAPFHVRKCIKQGRKVRITYVAATQRPVGVERALIDQADHLFVFRMVGRDDLALISPRLGMSPHELARSLNALGPHEYLRHTLGSLHTDHMPALPPDVIAYTRRHLVNPQFSQR